MAILGSQRAISGQTQIMLITTSINIQYGIEPAKISDRVTSSSSTAPLTV